MPTTVTVNEPLAPSPSPSSTVHVTVVTPIGNVDPEGGLHTTAFGFPAGFVAVAEKLTTAPEGSCAVTTIGPGRLSVMSVLAAVANSGAHSAKTAAISNQRRTCSYALPALVRLISPHLDAPTAALSPARAGKA